MTAWQDREKRPLSMMGRGGQAGDAVMESRFDLPFPMMIKGFSRV